MTTCHLHPVDSRRKETEISNQAYNTAFSSDQATAIAKSVYWEYAGRPGWSHQSAAQMQWEARRDFAIKAASKAVQAARFAGKINY